MFSSHLTVPQAAFEIIGLQVSLILGKPIVPEQVRVLFLAAGATIPKCPLPNKALTEEPI